MEQVSGGLNLARELHAAACPWAASEGLGGVFRGSVLNARPAVSLKSAAMGSTALPGKDYPKLL